LKSLKFVSKYVGNYRRALTLTVFSMLALVGVYFIGLFLLNKPFDPSNKALPMLYFSADWRWEPDAADLKPRPECWGGLLFALATVIVYAGAVRKDALAWRLGLWGVLGGALGFPLGQCLQAFHAWNREAFTQGLWAWLDPSMNWWNMMETTYGAIMGATLGLGLWLNRNRIRPVAVTDYIPAEVEAILLAIHLPLLLAVEFMALPAVDALYDLGLIMGIIPIVAVTRGRWWPYLAMLPVTLLPIAGKTVRQLVIREEAINPVLGWAIYLIVPLLVVTAAAFWFARQAEAGQSARAFTRRALILCTWVYFLLNFAFFHFPWPWLEWTGRTPNGIIFTICAFGLTVLALLAKRQEPSSPRHAL